jgi:hypothetical protein
MQKEFNKIPKASDVMLEPAGQSMRSKALSKLKYKLNMKDGDEHFLPIAVGPINNMYLQIREYSAFPFGAGRMNNLIHDTQSNRR